MKVVEFNKIGGPEVLELVEREIPQPEPNEIVVKIKACGLNQAELLFFQGQYLFQPEFPSKVGLEASGIIESIGSEVDDFEKGDEVCLTPNIMPYEYGYIGEYALVPKEAVIKKPVNLSFEEGASFWMTYGTGYAGLVLRGGIDQLDNPKVLITAASSGVGIASIQMAKHLGAEVFATTRNVEKKQFLLDQGADHVIVTSEENLVDRIKELTSAEGVDLVFDPIAGSLVNELAEVTKAEGKMVLYGALSREFDTPLPLFPLFAKGIQIQGVHLVFHLLQSEERFEKAQEHLLSGLESGVYKPVINKTFPLDQVQEAYRYMESNDQMGKILIAP